MIVLDVPCSVVTRDGRVKFNVDPGARGPRIVVLGATDAFRSLQPGKRYRFTIEELDGEDQEISAEDVGSVESVLGAQTDA